MRSRPRPANYPAFGYCLDNGGVVGVILLLFSEVQTDGETIVRANVSSWYVEPAFRAFAPLMVKAAIKDKNVTYFNITPAPHTWSTVEAQGFSVYCKGQVYGALMLSPSARGAKVELFSASNVAGLTDYEADLSAPTRRLRLSQYGRPRRHRRLSVRLPEALRQRDRAGPSAALLPSDRRRQALCRKCRALPGAPRRTAGSLRRERTGFGDCRLVFGKVAGANMPRGRTGRASGISPSRKPRCSTAKRKGARRRADRRATITRVSRSRALRAAPLAARRAEKASAVPAPGHRLERAAYDLSHKQ